VYSIEASANAYLLWKIPKLSELGCDYSRGNGSVLGVTNEAEG
jgi:hypothetical protein